MLCPVCTFPREQKSRCNNCGWLFNEVLNEKPEAHQQRLQKHRADWHAKDVPMPEDFAEDNFPSYEFILIEAQQFTMGSPTDEIGRDEDEEQHDVQLSNSFFIGRTEVSQALYRSVIGDNPSSFLASENPVESLTWLEACLFCNTYSSKMGLSPVYDIQVGKPITVRWHKQRQGYRLPTEAEWECAAKTLSKPKEAFQGWYAGTSQLKTHFVGQQSGISDMAGNVWEMCWDYYDAYPSGTITDPTGPTQGTYRVARGGSWIDPDRIIRPANRGFVRENARGNSVGFRLVLAQHAE